MCTKSIRDLVVSTEAYDLSSRSENSIGNSEYFAEEPETTAN